MTQTKYISKGERTRDRILETAADLFVTQGFHATSTRQITDRLGMARGSLYSHFNGKDEIFEAVLEKYHPWFQIPECVAAAKGETIEEFVHDAAHRLLAAWDQRPDLARLHLIELLEFQGRHLPQLFGINYEKMIRVLRNLMRDRPSMNKLSPISLSRALLGLFFGYLMADKFSGAGFNFESDQSAFEYFTDAYLFGVLNKDRENSSDNPDRSFHARKKDKKKERT